MINIAILTSEDNILTEKIIQYFNNLGDTQISCVITNIDTNIDKRLRRYRIPVKTISLYKEMDKFLTETETHYIITVDYNEKLPPNFCLKYDWKIFNLIKNKNGIEINHIKEKKDTIIFTKDLIREEENLKIKKDKINELAISLFPTIIEKTIKTYHQKIYTDYDTTK